MSSTAPATGRQHQISTPDGRVAATVTEVGASLRRLAVGGVELVPPYPLDAPTPAASGVVLVPWPNRVRDGRWTHGERSFQLALTEPQLGNASHGLLRFAPYRLASDDAAAVRLIADVFPQTGYPFHLATSVEYRVHETGIDVTHRLATRGAQSAPVAVGTHPYLQIGGVATGDLVVRASGASRYLLDDRKLPVGRAPVDAATDLRGGRRIAELELDTCYTDLTRDADGRVRTTLTAPDGRTLTMWQGHGFDHVQVFTTDRYPGQPVAVALEPMTAPADALNGGGMRWLAPGEEWVLHWGITLS